MDDTDKLPENVIIDRTVGKCKKHKWIIADPDPNSELVGLVCVNCSTGILVAKENVSKHLGA